MIVELAKSIQKQLLFLNSADGMLDWVIDHPVEITKFIRFYDSCVYFLNRLPADNPLMKIMPATAKLKSALGDTPVPLSRDYEGFTGLRTFFKGVKNAMGPMYMGQNLQMGVVESTSDFKQYGVKTPSLDTTSDALTFGTTGHLLERAFFSWADMRGIRPTNGWGKDTYLNAIDEVVMVHIASGQSEGTCADYFIKPPANGGLGWIKPDDALVFGHRLWDIYCG
jgi:hypothetical protein